MVLVAWVLVVVGAKLMAVCARGRGVPDNAGLVLAIKKDELGANILLTSAETVPSSSDGQTDCPRPILRGRALQ
jgi:hypothetical protein